MRILVAYYSLYGNTLKMARAAAEGAGSVKGAEVSLMRVPETIAQEHIDRNERMKNAQILQKGIPVVSVKELPEFDALIIGSPARFGAMSAQMKSFLDQTEKLLLSGALENRPGGVFTCAPALQGGAESALLSMIVPLLHLGLYIVGVPYSAAGAPGNGRVHSPFGASFVSEPERPPGEAELGVAALLGRRVAELAAR